MWVGQMRRAGVLLLLIACTHVPAGAAQQGTAPQATTIFTAMPSAVAYDTAGNLYVALQADHVIRKVDALGAITIVAGTGEQGFSGDGGAATGAQLDSPSGLSVDAAGALYIADTRNHRIRRVAGGIITTIAGTGSPGYFGDGGIATAAQLDAPAGLSLDSAGNLYIADSANHVIRKLSGTIITTVAGTGQQGFSGDGAAATAAQLDTPTGVAADRSTAGRFYIADRHNHRVRLVDANGIITTVAGTGLPTFSGDGGSGAAAGLAGPRGVTMDAGGSIYVADTDNQRIRMLSGGTIISLAGNGEQGFAGDIGTATSATLDTPLAPAVSTAGVLAFADAHNQRVRSIASGQINTVAGIAPPLTSGLLVSGSTSGVYDTALGSLTAVLSNGANQETGPISLYRDGVSVATQALAANRATFDLSGTPGGLHAFAVSFAGDALNAPATSGVYLVNISAAQQTLTFPALPSPVTYAAGLTSKLAATSSTGLPVTYSVTGPATVQGSTLTYTGPGSVVVTAVQAGNSKYAAASVMQTVMVAPSINNSGGTTPLLVTGVTPSTVTLATSNVVLSVGGGGFSTTSVVLLNGKALPTAFVNSTLLTATLPQLMTTGPQSITVFDSATMLTSNAGVLTVTIPGASALLSVPGTSSSAQQPTVSLQLQAGYPVPLAGVLTLAFAPNGNQGVDDPNIQFSTGGRTLNFVVPANSTTTPSVAIQTGTVAGVVTVTLSLTAQGVDVTPAGARLATILIPRQAPVATITFTQEGSTLTVVAHGYSNTRDMTEANFTFTAAPGSSLATTSLSLPASTLFSTWYGDVASAAEGSIFTYTQIFQLSDSTAQVQSVGLQLTNTAGASTVATSP